MINTLLFQEIVYRGSYGVVFVLLYMIIRTVVKRKFFGAFMLLVVLSVGVWMRFVEPQQIVIDHQQIDLGIDTRVTVIADMHLGVYKDQSYLYRVVDMVNVQDIDMVLIAGDFLNNPRPSQDLSTLFGPLRYLKVPWYAVMGNHDMGVPGVDHSQSLTHVLKELGGQVIDNQVVSFDDWTLIGLGSHMAGDDNVLLLNDLDDTKKKVVLAHNPDSTINYTRTVDLTIAGHTHCGQIRIPYLYEYYRRLIVPVVGNFDCGLTPERFTQLYITPGLGEVGLPLRLFNPPTILILDL